MIINNDGDYEHKWKGWFILKLFLKVIVVQKINNL